MLGGKQSEDEATKVSRGYSVYRNYKLKERAKELRNESTLSEVIIWTQIKKDKY